MSLQDATFAHIAEYLLGTCVSAEDAAEAFEVTLDDVLAAATDQDIFLCDVCGWWCERSEQSDGEYTESSGDEVCQDCDPSLNED